MGSLSIWHWMIVIVVVLLLLRPRQDFRPDGRRRAGHQGLQEGHGRRRQAAETKTEPAKTIDHQAAAAPTPKTETERRAEGARS